jgi:serine/threonine protein phosphatase PrpC/DNA modification methylase
MSSRNRTIRFGRSGAPDRLICGDNLEVLQNLADESLNLIYVDPPFATGTVRRGRSPAPGAPSPQYRDAPNDPDAFVNWMQPRMEQFHRVLHHSGSLFIHLDHRAVHYIKVALDRLFGRSRFVNELIWCYSVGGKSRRSFARKHDTILWYARSKDYAFYPDAVRIPRKSGTHMRTVRDENGELVQEKTDRKTGKVYRYPVNRGKVPEDWWTDIETLNREDGERTGWPTQKPERLLTRIILATTETGDTVADFFCGSATTAVVAQRHNRAFLAVDANPDAAEIAAKRLTDAGRALDPAPRDLVVSRQTDIKASMLTDVGVVRDHNEDAAYVDPKHEFFIVADGMGGHAAGEVASAMAVETVRGALESAREKISTFAEAPSDRGRKELVQLLEAAVRDAHQAVFQRGVNEPDKQGMGTTLDVLMVAGADAFVAHVGDSRTYLIREGRAAQITTDHTVAEVLVIEGKLSVEEAAASPLRTILVNAIGVAADVGVEMAHLRLKKDDQILLCSDGLHDYFPVEQEIADKSDDGALDKALSTMVDLAKERGGHDNITGVLISVLDIPDVPDEDAKAHLASDGIPHRVGEDETLPVDVGEEHMSRAKANAEQAEKSEQATSEEIKTVEIDPNEEDDEDDDDDDDDAQVDADGAKTVEMPRVEDVENDEDDDEDDEELQARAADARTVEIPAAETSDDAGKARGKAKTDLKTTVPIRPLKKKGS